MTFKILIVDDEPIICRGLKQTIPWGEHNIEVVDTACDGQDAIEKIKFHQNIDLVITDVRMPNMDGLQLAAFLAENYPMIQLVMISGYDEFKYAQQAIHLGVKDYLLKPVDVDELLQVISKITNEIKEEQRESKSLQQTIIRNAIYNQIFDYPLKSNENAESRKNVHVYPFLSMMENYGKIMEQAPDNKLESIKFQWKNALDEFLSHKGLDSTSIFTSENVLLTCITADQKNKCGAKDILPVIENAVADQSLSLLFVVNKTTVELGDLNESYSHLKQHTKYLPFDKEGRIICPVKEFSYLETQIYPNDILHDLINAVFQCQETEIRKQTDHLFHYLKYQQFFLKDTASVCEEVITGVLKHLEAISKQIPDKMSLYFKQQVDVEVFNSYELLQELLERDIKHIVSQFHLKKAKSKDWLIERAEDYIKSYYTSDVKVQEVADVVNISPNYFSSLFKQKTGKNFTEYINELRVEKAKVLLKETPFKVNEIASQVGYHEYKYFVEVFKRFSGVTPTTYRKIITTESQQ